MKNVRSSLFCAALIAAGLALGSGCGHRAEQAQTPAPVTTSAQTATAPPVPLGLAQRNPHIINDPQGRAAWIEHTGGAPAH